MSMTKNTNDKEPHAPEVLPSGSLVDYTVASDGSIVGGGSGVLLPVNGQRENAIQQGELFAIVTANKDRHVDLETAVEQGKATMYRALEVRPPQPIGQQDPVERALHDSHLLCVVTAEAGEGWSMMTGSASGGRGRHAVPTVKLYFRGTTYPALSPDQYLEVSVPKENISHGAAETSGWLRGLYRKVLGKKKQ